MPKHNFMIYGSYGYTGQLIAEYACQQGLRPVLAGRNADKLKAQAAELSLDYVVFDLDNLNASTQALLPFIAVIHCAGPFIRTYKQMADACLAAHTHYLDITGEVEVIEGLSKMDALAKAANMMLLPGAGFDVVPSDCLAMHVKKRLPSANRLILTIASGRRARTAGSSISRGTMKTMLANLSQPTLMRDEGVLKEITSVQQARVFSFLNGRQKMCMPISWGDLASAWRSTGIPHIETYMAMSNRAIRIFKLIRPFRFIFKLKLVQRWLEFYANRLPEGPTLDLRKTSFVNILAEASDRSGKVVRSMLTTPEGYDLTAMCTVEIVKRVMNGDVKVGFQTPSMAYGKDFILGIKGVSRDDG